MDQNINNNDEFKVLKIEDTEYRTKFTKKFENRKPYTPKNEKLITSFIPGIVVKILVKPGQEVKKGDTLLIIESMKMLNKLRSPENGKIKNINVSEGEKIPKDHLMIELE
jgi:biotin carboxyl carrier protein